MYNPAAFEENDNAVLHALIRQFSFGTLVTVAGGLPVATYMPFLVDTDGGGPGTLRAHMARANPHWNDFHAGAEALVIFQGPHAYISPAWYASRPNVPTWNYAAVHAYGVPRLLDAEETFDLLLASVAQYDPALDPAEIPED